MDLIYKTLFEIKLEHEYFLTFEDGKNLFMESDNAGRIASLEQGYADDRETISRDLRYEFPEKLRPLYKQHGLKLLQSYSGFRVVIRVRTIRLADNSTVFVPFFPLPEDLDIFILLNKKTNLPEEYTNGRIARPVPAVYLFSNDNLNGVSTFPFLVSPVSAIDTESAYEQGELALDTGNNLVELFYDNTGALQQKVITSAVQAFASENDRILVPGKFYYTITGNKPVTELDISVKDESANIVRIFSFSQAEPISRVLLDFTGMADQLFLTEKMKLPAAVHTLTATGNNGYSDSRRIAFSDHLAKSSVFGAVHIKPKVSNSPFNLLTDEGWIKQNRDPLGVLSPVPVFEIPFKSRFCNFRYLNSNGKELLLDPSLSNFLFKENEALISQMPVSLCRYYLQIPDKTGSITKYLPNPKSYDIRTDPFRRMYFDIHVPESELFSLP